MRKQYVLFLILFISIISISCNIVNLFQEQVPLAVTEVGALPSSSPLPTVQPEPTTPPTKTPTTEPYPSSTPTQKSTKAVQSKSSDPILWTRIHESRFNKEYMVRWDIDNYPVEYDFSTYKFIPSMQLQVKEPFLVLYPSGGEVLYTLQDTEVESFIAIPEPNIGVALVCRRQQTTGDSYMLLINQNYWWITKNVDGENHILTEGPTSETFVNGDWDIFRFRCEGDLLSAWDSRGLLDTVTDNTFTSGATGTFFFNDQDFGPGLVHIFQEHALSKASDREIGYVRDTFQSGDLFITYAKAWEFHGQVSEEDIEGIILSLDINFENRGTMPITINNDDIYIEWAEFQKKALVKAPESLEDTYPAQFPLTILPGEVGGGQIFFVNITQLDLMEGWQLVIDLQDQSLGSMRFYVPVQ